jgi:hypothetical protein
MPMDSVLTVYDNGDQLWRASNGERHRIGGPAVISQDGMQAWYVNGKLHRTDGPAIIWANGAREWCYYGKDITQEVNAWMQKQNIVWPWDAEIQAQFVLTFS